MRKAGMIMQALLNRLSGGDRTARLARSPTHGPRGIREVGHREYVGGEWARIGKLQFDYLVGQGLTPHHYLLDVGCGSLRGGVHFIPYLDKRHYLGIDKEARLISAGIAQELGPALFEQKEPQFVVSARFAFELFDARPDFALAQSLFTHLPASHIEACLRNLRPVIAERGVFFATFFECQQDHWNPSVPHDHGYFAYTRRQMMHFGLKNNWEVDYVGDWGHPRGQVMVRYRAEGPGTGD